MLATAAALSGVPVAADLLLSARPAVFRYFTSDTYYYLNIARNAARTGMFSFDGERPTNGFHPLWQALLALLYKACIGLGASELTFCYAVVLLGALLISFAVLLVGRTHLHARGDLPDAFVLVPAGLYALLLAPAWISAQTLRQVYSAAEGPLPLQGTLWSYANGMESGIALLGFGVLMALAVGGPPRTVRAAALLGLAGAFAVLARLDQVFVAGAILGALALRLVKAEGRGATPRVAAMGVSFGSPIALYLLVNLAYAGVAFPVSGASKVSLAAAGRSNFESLGIVLATGQRTADWLDRLFRLAQILIPAAAAAAVLLASRRRVRGEGAADARPTDELDRFLSPAAVGVLAHCAFVFFFTGAKSSGSWSMPVPVLFVSLAALAALRTAPPRELLLPAAGVAAALAVFFALHRQPDHHEKYRVMYDRAGAVRKAYAAKPQRLIELDDGIVGFATGFQTLSGMGFAADRELQEAIRAGRLLPLAHARGFDRIGCLVYLPERASPQVALRFLASAYPDETGTARYTLEYYDPALPFAIVRIDRETVSPRPASP